MLLSDLVDALDRAALADRRADKVSTLAKVLRRTAIEDVEGLVALAVGTLRPAHDIAGWTAVLDDEIAPAPDGTLTVDDVRRVAQEMSIASGPQAVEAASQSLAELLERATETEQSTIRSMLDPAGEGLITTSVMSSAIANAARVRVGDVRRAASVNGSLAMTATLAFVEGTAALESVEPRPGRPIQPMQAAPADDLDEARFDASCVEWAPTGLRLQAHRAGRTVSLFVHDGPGAVDVTDRLPHVVDLVLSMPGDDLVLDGELDGSELPHPSGAGTDRAVRFFDLLFDGDALLDRPLANRRRALDVVVPAEHRLPSVETSHPAVIESFLDDAQASGRPGVVVKDLESVYEPGHSGRSWRLVASVPTLDLVVVAAEWGTGRRSDKLSRLHLGARTADGGFETVGRTALGVTDEMLTWQTDRLQQLAVDDDQPAGLVTVRPEQVVEVTFESVHEARRGGHAISLRSARVRRYRDDKRAADCDTVETVRALVQSDEREDDRTWGDASGPRRRAEDLSVDEVDDVGPRLPPARPSGLDAAQAEAAKRIREVLAERTTTEPAAEEPDPANLIPPPASLPVTGYLRGHIATLDLDFAPYEEPTLETGRATHALVMIVRFLTLGWAVAVTTGALITRSEPAPIDPSLVESISWAGIPLVLALAVSGWAWSDRLTRNLKRLDGRLPPRWRCATAWLAPPLAVALLAVTIVQVGPTDVVDVRPSIIVVVFAAVMWRPYALIRRIFATLIRIRFDALLAAGYVLDLVAFGLLWWRLTAWAGVPEPMTRGDVEILIGIGAAVSVALAANVVVWRAIVRAGDRAEAHRAASQRTRYEHRMLRLRGVDPTDPEVWWALVQRRADEQREEEERLAAAAAAEAGSSGDGGGGGGVAVAPAPAVVPTVDELVDSVKQKHSVAFRRLGDEQSDELVERLREQFSTVVGDLAGMPLDDAEADGTGEPAPAGAKSVDPDATPSPVGAGKLRSVTEAPVEEPDAAPADDGDADEGSTPPVVGSPLERLAARTADETVEGDQVASPLERLAAQPPGEDAVSPLERLAARSGDATSNEGAGSPLERLAARSGEAAPGEDAGSPLERFAARSSDADADADADAEPERGDGADGPTLGPPPAAPTDADPVSALKRRLGLDETVEDVKSPLEQLLGQAGTVQVEAALADRRQQEIEERPRERLVPPRLYTLEWTRLLLVAAFAIVTAAGGWLVTESLGASGSSSDGSLGVAALDVDLARRSFVGAYSVAVALVPLWTFAVLTYARRCGMEHAKPRRHLVMFGCSAVLCVVAFVLDGTVRGGTTVLMLIPAALIAATAAYLVEPARYWFELPSVTLTIWTFAVPGMLVIAWLGGLLSPVDSLSSLQLLAFFTVTVSLVSALITVLIALSASDIEDEIRLSPELAVPLSEAGRRRS